MEKFMEIYAEYHSIQASYSGPSTDWKEAYEKLKDLEIKCKNIKIRDGKNYWFYSWLKTMLHREIYQEIKRLYAKI